MGLGIRYVIYLSEDTRHSVFILILKIRAVAPFQHQHSYVVFTYADVVGYIYLTCIVTYLTVSCKASVDIQIKAGVNALKKQAYISSLIVLSCQGKAS